MCNSMKFDNRSVRNFAFGDSKLTNNEKLNVLKINGVKHTGTVHCVLFDSFGIPNKSKSDEILTRRNMMIKKQNSQDNKFYNHDRNYNKLNNYINIEQIEANKQQLLNKRKLYLVKQLDNKNKKSYMSYCCHMNGTSMMTHCCKNRTTTENCDCPPCNKIQEQNNGYGKMKSKQSQKKEFGLKFELTWIGKCNKNHKCDCATTKPRKSVKSITKEENNNLSVPKKDSNKFSGPKEEIEDSKRPKEEHKNLSGPEDDTKFSRPEEDHKISGPKKEIEEDPKEEHKHLSGSKEDHKNVLQPEEEHKDLLGPKNEDKNFSVSKEGHKSVVLPNDEHENVNRVKHKSEDEIPSGSSEKTGKQTKDDLAQMTEDDLAQMTKDDLAQMTKDDFGQMTKEDLAQFDEKARSIIVSQPEILKKLLELTENEEFSESDFLSECPCPPLGSSVLLKHIEKQVDEIDDKMDSLQSVIDCYNKVIYKFKRLTKTNYCPGSPKTGDDRYVIQRSESNPSIICIRPPKNKQFKTCDNYGTYRDCIRINPQQNHKFFIHGNCYKDEDEMIDIIRTLINSIQDKLKILTPNFCTRQNSYDNVCKATSVEHFCSCTNLL